MLNFLNVKRVKARLTYRSQYPCEFFKTDRDRGPQDSWRRFDYFKKQWAGAVNDDRAKSKIVACDEWITNDHGSWMVSKGTGRCRQSGWIDAEHHILYNMVTGRAIDKGFTRITNWKKLHNGGYPYMHFNYAVNNLIRHIKTAQKYTTQPVKNHFEYNELERLMDFLKPFGQAISLQQMATGLDLTKLETIKQWD